MERIDILVVVDVASTNSTGTLRKNIYLIDTNKYFGSWQEGQSQLHTVCQNGQMLVWSVVPVDPATNVEIKGFSGPAVAAGVCRPAGIEAPGSAGWTGMVQSQGEDASFRYTVTLGINAGLHSFDAYLKTISQPHRNRSSNMANQICVLIVVDVEGALSSGNLGSNVYLVDTNKHVGSGNEGQAELYTNCVNGQIINWSVAPVDPNTDAEISGFTGQAVDERVIQPQQVNQPGGVVYWSAEVQTQGATGQYQYSCTLTFDGTPMQFDPFLTVTSG